jgi:NADH:ubiquinone oxidoreductase subunit 3 (subunit A)
MTMTAIALSINAALVLVLVWLFSSANGWFGPASVHAGDGMLPYETGMPPIEPAIDRMSVVYYRFAVLFVVFDVDLAFLLPWAVNRGTLDSTQLWAITAFVALVMFMLCYFWRQGALECD